MRGVVSGPPCILKDVANLPGGYHMQGPTEEHPNYQLQAMLFTLTAQQQGWCLGPRALITDGISFSKPPYEVGCARGRKGCRHSHSIIASLAVQLAYCLSPLATSHSRPGAVCGELFLRVAGRSADKSKTSMPRACLVTRRSEALKWVCYL